MTKTSTLAVPRRSRSLTAPLTAEEKMLDEIEAGSRSPFGHWHAGCKLIDIDILRGFADPDEIDHEEEMSRHHERQFRRIDEFQDGRVDELASGFASAADFRDGIDFAECSCDHAAGQVCIKCCTNLDLTAMPPGIQYERVNRRAHMIGGREEQVFDLVISLESALQAGLISDIHAAEELPENPED